jgi:pyruvoyl-dependent arginine decarboxylase (PvlArgDC)
MKDDSQRVFQSGKAITQVSELNAVDLALKNAGIAQCNLVSVSSVLYASFMERKWLGWM